MVTKSKGPVWEKICGFSRSAGSWDGYIHAEPSETKCAAGYAFNFRDATLDDWQERVNEAEQSLPAESQTDGFPDSWFQTSRDYYRPHGGVHDG
jgi:hypothetical protein